MRFAAAGPARRRCHRRAAAGWRTCGRRGARGGRVTQRRPRSPAPRKRASLLRQTGCGAAHCAPEVGGLPQLGAEDGTRALQHVACVDQARQSRLRASYYFSHHYQVSTRLKHQACEARRPGGAVSAGRSGARAGHGVEGRAARHRAGAPRGWSRCSVSAYSRDTTRPKPEKSKSAPPGGPPGETAPAAGRTARRKPAVLSCSRAGSLRPTRPGGPARRGPQAPLHAGAAAAGAEPRQAAAARLPQPSAALALARAAIAPPRALPCPPRLFPCAPELLASAPERRARLLRRYSDVAVVPLCSALPLRWRRRTRCCAP